MDDDLARNRAVWTSVNEDLSEVAGQERWRHPEVVWGLFGIAEATVHLVGDVSGQAVVELGCGVAYLSAWLRRAGARPIAVDLSPAQLDTARRCQSEHGLSFPLVEADAGAVPLRSGRFDLVVSEYGAAPWAEPSAWVGEAARLLRPGGRLVFLTNSVLAGLCVPAEGGFAGDRLLRSPRDLARITWPGGGTEHHPGHGEWIRLLRAAGFVIDALHELHPPADSATNEHYEIVTADWAQRWPAEDAWVAHLPA